MTNIPTKEKKCKHKQLIQYQSFAPQCQDCGVYMVTRKRNPLSSKSFFDFSEEEQKEILNQAADDSNKAQQELMDIEEQVCTCGMEPCDPKCKACPCHCHVFCPGSISFQEAGDIKAMCSCSPQECIHCTPLLDTDEGYYDSTMHWHTGKPPTKGNRPEIPDSSEAWEKEYSDFIKSIEKDEVFITEGYAFYDELKDFIHTLLKNKESMTRQTIWEKVLKLPNMAIPPTTGEKIMLNLDDVLKLLE